MDNQFDHCNSYEADLAIDAFDGGVQDQQAWSTPPESTPPGSALEMVASVDAHEVDEDAQIKDGETSEEFSSSLADAVRRNSDLLEQLVQQLNAGQHSSGNQAIDPASEDAIEAVDENIRLREENESLAARVNELQSELEIIYEQNEELASKVAHEDVQRSVSQSGGDSQTLSWEERKLQILEQMEDDSFDAEEFISTLKSNPPAKTESVQVDVNDCESPAQFVEALHDELQRMGELILRHEEETRELQQLLRQEESNENPDPVAAAIDQDEVIQQERENLRQLKAEWEERFRKTEIEASLERAKMSRERTEMQQENERLKGVVEDLRRQVESTDSETVASTRWMAKLGLGPRNTD